MEDNREKKEMRKRRVTFKPTRAIKIGKLNPDSFFWYLQKCGAKVVFLTMNHLQCWKKLAITNALEVKRKSNICYNSQLGNWREFGKTLSRAFSHRGFSTKLNFDDLGYPKWKDILWRQMARFSENCKIGLYENNKVFSSLCTL